MTNARNLFMSKYARNLGLRHSPTARISQRVAPARTRTLHTRYAHATDRPERHTPESCKSNACPRLKSWTRYLLAFGTSSITNIVRSVAKAPPGETPGNRFA